MFAGRKIFTMLVVTAAFWLGAQAFAEGAKIEAPQFSDKKEVREYYREWFYGNKKVSAESFKVYEITCEGRKCLLYESSQIWQGKQGRKKVSLTDTVLLIVGADDMVPVYGELIRKGEGLEFETKVRVSREGGRLVFTARNVTNGKAAERVLTGEPDERIYFQGMTVDVYGRFYMKVNETAHLRSYSLLAMEFLQNSFFFAKTKKEKWDGREIEVRVVEHDIWTMWYDEKGELLQMFLKYGAVTVRSTDAEGCADFDRTLEGYTPPAFLEKDTAVMKRLGLKVVVPYGTYSVQLIEGKRKWLAFRNDLNRSYLVVNGISALPEKVDPEAILKHWAEYSNSDPEDYQFVAGKGETVKINGVKYLTGEFTEVSSFEEIRGRYYAFVEDGRGAVVLIGAPVKLWDACKDELIKSVESIQIIKQDLKPEPPVFTSKEYGLVMSAPGAWWESVPAATEKWNLCRFDSAWRGSAVLLWVFQLNEGDTVQAIADDVEKDISQIKDARVIERCNTKVGGVDAVRIRYSLPSIYRKAGQRRIGEKIYFARGNILFLLEGFCDEETYDDFKGDFEKIIKSIVFNEQDIK